MPGRRRSCLVLMTMLTLLSCATTTERGPFTAAGRGDRLLADSMHMTGNEKLWGRGMQLAEFHEGRHFEGVQCIEVRIPFGETAIGWTFTGLAPGAPVEVTYDLNVDFFDKQTYLHVAYMPGSHSAEKMEEPREEFRSFQEHGWADGSARWPDSTDGWRTVRFDGQKADEKGDFTVMMIFGHPKDDPPLVFAYITNPAVRVVAGQ